MNGNLKNTVGSPREDALLITAFQGGDRTAFDKLVLKHKNKVFNLCYWMIGDYQEANDTAQETFIKVFGSLKKFRFESSFSTWLFRIAVNTCKNRLKSSEFRQKKKTISLDNPGDPETDRSLSQIKDEAPSPSIELERKERMMLINEAIDSLPAEQKEVVVLRDMEGFSYEEIVEITGLNVGTLKSRLARARLNLRNRLRSVI
ncbi:MAG TPA: sigma-70 family RNA polymerase sigma factor [Thermodesulfobacteriota bacterium]|nr:sigma-70 family RNA polymerase sigma factor [Thermodesulfobacteriota bacterium]